MVGTGARTDQAQRGGAPAGARPGARRVCVLAATLRLVLLAAPFPGQLEHEPAARGGGSMAAAGGQRGAGAGGRTLSRTRSCSMVVAASGLGMSTPMRVTHWDLRQV